VISLAMYAVLEGARSAWLAVLAGVVLVIAAAPFLFRTHYQLDAQGISERRGFVTRSRRWDELRRFELGRDAALVSPYARTRWLDRYRGITIYFDGGDRAAVVAALERHLGAQLGA
jgi:hypothetical protein